MSNCFNLKVCPKIL